jgi:hypothetical protein
MSTTSSGFANYLVRELRCASLRARLAANEIQTMGLALRLGLIGPEVVLEHLHEVGVLHLIEASS